MEYPTTFNYKTNELFKPAQNSHYNACVGGNSRPYDLVQYGDGFYDGGNAIVDAVKDDNPKVDVLAYPAAFSGKADYFNRTVFDSGPAAWEFFTIDYASSEKAL